MTTSVPKTRLRVIAAASVLIIIGFDLLPSSLRSHFDNLFLGAFAVFVALLVAASIWLPIETRSLRHRTEILKLGKRSVEDRLDELERLKRRDMVTPDEYTAKRQDILKDL